MGGRLSPVYRPLRSRFENTVLVFFFVTVCSSAYKYVGLGPLISDETAYLSSTRKGISQKPNFGIYDEILAIITTNQPLSSQWLYVIVNCVLLSWAILLVTNELPETFGRFPRYFILGVIACSGIAMYCATVMPEIIILFLASLLIYCLRNQSLSIQIRQLLIISVICVGPLIKPHFLIVTLALILAHLETLLRRQNKFKKKDFSAAAIIVAIVAGLTYNISANSTAIGIYNDHFQKFSIDINTLRDMTLQIVIALLLFSILFSGPNLIKYSKTYLEKIYIRNLFLITLIIYGFFSAEAGSLGEFEANRFHGRYYLMLMFSIVPLMLNKVAKENGFYRVWLLIIGASSSILLLLQIEFLNIYPWDDPFFSGLFIGTTPWGWTIGTRPILLTLVVFSLFMMLNLVMLRIFRKNSGFKSAVSIWFVVLVLSSNLHNLAWLQLNKVSIQGQSIRYALDNPNLKCVPSGFLSIYVNPNVERYVPDCKDGK